VYQEFLTVFSEIPGIHDSTDVQMTTKAYLDATINVAEFGNLRLPYVIANDPEKRARYHMLINEMGEYTEIPLQTLEDFIKVILNARYKNRLNDGSIKAIRSIGAEHFGPMILDLLLRRSQG
jgi:hypothetical protein